MRLPCRAVLAAILVLACADPGWAMPTGRILGGVVAPDGLAAAGCRVTVAAVDHETTYRSGPTDEDGRFELRVPAGKRYRATTIGLPDGRSIAVRHAPPLAPAPGQPARIDLRVVPTAPAPAASGSGRPWYATTAVLIGIAAGVAALIVILRDDTELDVSPSDPES